jgi:hypothetical protein
MKVSGNLQTWPLYLRENSSRYPLDRLLGGPQSRSGTCGETFCPAGNQTSLVQPVVLPTELSTLLNSFLIRIVGGGVQTGSTRHVGHFWPIVHSPCDCEDGEFGGMKIVRGNQSTRRKPAPEPLCPPKIPLDHTRARTRAVAV